MKEKVRRNPENPSQRFKLPDKWQCDCCKRFFHSRNEFIEHLEKEKHRVCYKCGQKVGGWIEWTQEEFMAIRRFKNGIETWKYKHRECPLDINPSKRWY